LEQRKKIKFEEMVLSDFIDRLEKGQFLVPSFQRSFVWDPVHISSLWDSIYHFYPIGSILYWKTDIRLHVHRRLGGYYIPDKGKARHNMYSYILDGQQRTTSLLVSFTGGTGRVKEQNRFDFTIYFDATNASFFFQKELYKHKWHAAAAFLVRLGDVPSLPPDYADNLSGVSGFNNTVARNLQQLQCIFKDYHIPMICLQGYDINNVCDIYERMNQNGMKLENLDIIIARNFQNNPTIIEEDFAPET